MCGIAGIYSINQKQNIDLKLLKEMTDRIRHRGLQDEGYLAFDLQRGKIHNYGGAESSKSVQGHLESFDHAFPAQLGFGFRRLPTVDLSESGHQPMLDEKLGLAIIFNGEVYNHPEIRAELQGLGYDFIGHSDTEVILRAYHAWGEAAVHRLNGMWAFAIWDIKNKSLFLSRDRFGIKPLYYAYKNGVLYWGSEIKQIVLAPLDLTQNAAMIWRSMKVSSMMVYDDETYWQEIHSLKPGHNMRVIGGKIDIYQYYKLDPATFESSNLSFEDAAKRYRELFRESLRIHLHSDVEIASSLSGGLDSSAITCMASGMLDYPLQTFSTYYADEPGLDERPYIQIVAANCDVTSHLIAPQAEDALTWWKEASYLNDMPCGSGFVSQYALMKSTYDHGIRVLLCGHGSDEISGGYRHGTYRYFADLLRGMKLGRFASELRHFLGHSPLETASNLGKIAMSSLMKESRLYAIESKYYRFEPFVRDFVKEAEDQVTGKMMDQIADLPVSRLSSFLYNMMHSTSLQTLLHAEDRISMAHSVESRAPFLDHRLVEFVFTLPSKYKIRPPYRKVIHREALRDCVPREISERKDKGIFGSPLHTKWMRNQLKEFIRDILYSSEFRSRGVWELPKIYKHWQAYLQGKNDEAEMLYSVISLELWYRSFFDGTR